MSMWKLDLEGFAEQWLDVADRFEAGAKAIVIPTTTPKEAEQLRFEWYAFKSKLRKAEEAKAAEERMYQTLPRIKAELGTTVQGQPALRLILRDVDKTARLLANATVVLGDSEDDTGFVPN